MPQLLLCHMPLPGKKLLPMPCHAMPCRPVMSILRSVRITSVQYMAQTQHSESVARTTHEPRHRHVA